MEDFIRIERPFAGREHWLYAAVFDGHGGAQVARRASTRLHALIAAELRAGRPSRDAMSPTFLAFDEEVAEEPSGATAAVVLAQGNALTVANVGDSHVVLVSQAEARILTTDHRLTNEAEYRRVVAAGARIWGPYACLPDGRGLMPTRTLGDREYRPIGIVADPDVAIRTLETSDVGVVVASDGVWDALSPDVVGGLVRRAATASAAAAAVAQRALADSSDNVSVVVILRT